MRVLAYDNRAVDPESTRFGSIAINYASLRHLIVEVQASDGTGERNTNFAFQLKDIVDDILLEVITPETSGSTKTISIGLATSEGGVVNGFANGLSVAAAGVIPLSRANGAVTAGAYLNETIGSGVVGPKPYVIGSAAPNARTLVYQFGSAFSQLYAKIHVFYRRLEGDRA